VRRRVLVLGLFALAIHGSHDGVISFERLQCLLLQRLEAALLELVHFGSENGFGSRSAVNAVRLKEKEEKG
jgi:hypothetical protein